MKNITKETKTRLARYKELYSAALLAAESGRDSLYRHMDQYQGSDEIDGSAERAGVVRNITYELIESEINADIPAAKVDTVSYSERREKNATAIERLCATMRGRIPFEELNDRDERYTYIYGGSVFYLEWDSKRATGGGEGAIRVHLLSPLDFIPQPSIDAVEDMEYCFLHFTTTREELITKYGADENEAMKAECEYLAEAEGSGGDAVAVIVCFYRDESGQVGRLVFSGDLALEDIPCYYKRKTAVCAECGNTVEHCDCAEPRHGYEDVERERITLNGEEIDIPYYVPTAFPIVVRRNTMNDGGMLGGSDCEKIRPQQQAINKLETRILQKLLRSGVTPIMPEGTAISLTNAVFGQIIKTRPGESIDSYGKIDTTPDVSQDIKEADRLYDQAKRILGITDAYQGVDATTSESGYARELKINRASVRLQTKRRMKQLAYCRLYELIFRHYLAFADEPRVFSYRDTMGRVHLSEFNRLDFIERDEGGNYYYDDGYTFTVDESIGSGYDTESLWELNLRNLQQGTLGDKDSAAALMRYWQLQDKAGFPYARENVEYFREMLSEPTEYNE